MQRIVIFFVGSCVLFTAVLECTCTSSCANKIPTSADIGCEMQSNSEMIEFMEDVVRSISALNRSVNKIYSELNNIMGGKGDAAQAPTPPKLNMCSSNTPDGLNIPQSGVKVYYSDGWTVFQRRYSGQVVFHTRTWKEYREGFGDMNTEFWLGLNKLHQITRQGGCKLRVDLGSWDGHSAWAEYSTFSVADESDLFRITVAGYIGTAGDALLSPNYETLRFNINGMVFTTNDRDNDRASTSNCPKYGDYGGWWHNTCAAAFPNAVFGRYTGTWRGIIWYDWRGQDSLKTTMLKVNCG